MTSTHGLSKPEDDDDVQDDVSQTIFLCFDEEEGRVEEEGRRSLMMIRNT